MTAAAPRIEFDPTEHRYLLGGAPAPSVTQVMDAEGLSGSPWWTETARKRGTAVHRIALLVGKRRPRGSTPEEIAANSLWDPSTTAPALVPYGMAVCRFYLETGLRPILVEEPVASPSFVLCGTLDLYGEMPSGKRRMVDFKSGEPQAAAWVQTALYVMCLEETHGMKTDERTVVWVRGDGTYKQWPVRPAGGEDLMVGCQAVNLYNWRKKHGMLG